uniref:NADH dehydrogenase subunit 5 n=1 Tax=Gracixalus yunnanensis TaxID=2596631 RepID=UPI001F1415FA|nr:NADH dehydrogenase subunit 5 [Gracixalus yunnanensis]UMI33295.1 NADH dehydrogenase subunit 5 [Gracixalus yunnanensis]
MCLCNFTYNLMAHQMILLLLMIIPLLCLKHKMFLSITKIMVMLTFFLSLTILILNYLNNLWVIYIYLPWLTQNASWLPLSTQFDFYASIFITVALFVSWSILEFSTWYMKEDPNLNIFMKYLLIFLMAMIILVSADNMLTLFIGWEGVGIMSYLLIGWYHSRNNAAEAAIQAMIYNRTGDMGFLMAFCWIFKNFGSINLDYMNTLPHFPTLILIALISAAASKSAQFGLHPWLAAAMEGPTPVSALLHSSTMVVAGIFLLIRIFPLLSQNQTAMTTCLCLGALSTLYTSTSALKQNDIKKIIAYSTSSQLGLMMVAIGIGQPHFAFFHICSHAFFKAMLFLCAGLFIHVLNNEQDIRKMGGLQRFFPVTTTCFSIGSFALMGTPFLSAFYSKDAIIESANISYLNSIALACTLVATTFTAVYTVRLINSISLHHIRTMNPTINATEQTALMAVKPIIRLAYGSVIAGFLTFNLLIPDNPVTHTMPLTMKLVAFSTTILAFIIATDLAKAHWKDLPYKSSITYFAPSLYSGLMHRFFTQKWLNKAGQIYSLIEAYLLKKSTTSALRPQKPPLRWTQSTQSGMIKAYLIALIASIFFAMFFFFS